MPLSLPVFSLVFFFNDTATTEIYTLSLHDALPISPTLDPARAGQCAGVPPTAGDRRSEEHTSELQSHLNLVCRLLLEKTKKKNQQNTNNVRRIAKLYSTRMTSTR